MVAGWEIVATVRQARSVPGDDAWARATAIVRKDHRPGDLIVFAPEWVDPIGRLHLGDLIPIEMAARMDAARYGRIWELSIRGGRSKDTLGLTPFEEADVDGVSVRRYERAPAVVLADVRDLLATAKTQGGTPRLELAEVGFEPHRCILVVPSAGTPVRITVQLTLGSELVGYVGLADIFKRREVREPATFEVAIGGRYVAAVTAGNTNGWIRFATPTTPGLAEVTFVIRADKPDRLVCFAAEARK